SGPISVHTAAPLAPPDNGTTWSASSIYTAGMTATENGVTYKANWWTQGADPAHNNGGAGTGEPWTIVAASNAPSSVPTVPTELVVSATSSAGTTLSWSAASVPGGGAVTGYAIFENDRQIATTTATSFAVINLAADTTYAFAVAALDAAGSSAESAADLRPHRASSTASTTERRQPFARIHALYRYGDAAGCQSLRHRSCLRHPQFHARLRAQLAERHRLARRRHDQRRRAGQRHDDSLAG